ncbi:MAG: hypothetical protein FWF46_05340 [Oscillospiraceae bacterium]|nr:hypothetical protein [Oscillospiraceae bacterium]
MLKLPKLPKWFTDIFKDLDKKIFEFMKKGFALSYFIGIISVLLLVIYKNSYISYDFVNISIILFRMSIFFLVQFFVCGIAVNKICKMH